MTIYLFLGLLLGTIAGLSGAGGAIIGIPLLVFFIGADLKAATALVLPVVALAAFLTWIPQRKFTEWLMVFRLAPALFLASWAAACLKPFLPDTSIKTALILISLWGLYQTWRTRKESLKKEISFYTAKAMGIGLLIGTVTTLTGLGGGIIMVPLFRQSFSLSQSAAVSTSLIAIIMGSLITMTTLYMQNQFQIFSPFQMMLVVVGISAVSIALRHWMKRTDPSQREKIQKWVYTLVLLFSIIGLLLR